MHHSNVPQQDTDDQTATQLDGLIAFLTARLTEDLARVWAREEQDPGIRPRPGAAAQVAVVDELLRTLSAGRLPVRFELRILLFGYCRHPDYDQRWADLLQDDSVSQP
jgi:hypothetical protein